MLEWGLSVVIGVISLIFDVSEPLFTNECTFKFGLELFRGCGYWLYVFKFYYFKMDDND